MARRSSLPAEVMTKSTLKTAYGKRIDIKDIEGYQKTSILPKVKNLFSK